MTAARSASLPHPRPKVTLPALGFLVLVALAPWSVEAAVPPPDDAVVATVEGQTITADEFAHEAAKHVPDGPGTMSLEQRRRVLAGLLDRDLVYIEASRKGFGTSDEPAVRRTIVDVFLRSEVYSTVRNSDFDDDQLKEYYEAHRAEFVVPAKRQLQLVTLEFGADRSEEAAREELAKLRERLVAAADTWYTVAQERSQDKYATRGGDVGFVSREGKAGLDPALVEAGLGGTIRSGP
ncbi:peptidyl-prolyl cis-trans isomerase [Myxococcota bacterium]|nr:peptidyl-prolyl cis-trans isomerase [Myxococcota bacterium]